MQKGRPAILKIRIPGLYLINNQLQYGVGADVADVVVSNVAAIVIFVVIFSDLAIELGCGLGLTG